ncbi:MAG: hypothetical protein AABX73_02880 [Nanoarchaeota archaeon]
MIKRGKKAQTTFGLSFGMIFSIILIIAFVSVAFYAIAHFLSLNKCTQVGLFLTDLQKEIDRAWTSGSYKDTFEGSLPSSGFFAAKITHVCFGLLTSPTAPGSKSEELNSKFESYYSNSDSNIFLEPPESACNGKLAKKKLQHIQTSEFFCLPANGKLRVRIEKGATDTLVAIKK